jgi:hypothetical protein
MLYYLNLVAFSGFFSCFGLGVDSNVPYCYEIPDRMRIALEWNRLYTGMYIVLKDPEHQESVESCVNPFMQPVTMKFVRVKLVKEG